jgi:uncharacterized protein YkuJ
MRILLADILTFGAAMPRLIYGKQVEEAYFDVDGNPILHKDGYARWTARFDERGNRVEQAHFDADDHAVMVDGVGAKARYFYDDNDQLVSVVYLDESDQAIPVQSKSRKPPRTARRRKLT